MQILQQWAEAGATIGHGETTSGMGMGVVMGLDIAMARVMDRIRCESCHNKSQCWNNQVSTFISCTLITTSSYNIY